LKKSVRVSIKRSEKRKGERGRQIKAARRTSQGEVHPHENHRRKRRNYAVTRPKRQQEDCAPVSGPSVGETWKGDLGVYGRVMGKARKEREPWKRTLCFTKKGRNRRRSIYMTETQEIAGQRDILSRTSR